MKFFVEHIIEYVYSRPVYLEPHTIRLRPRNDPAQREIEFDLTIDPAPAKLETALDGQGNSVAHAWFGDLTDKLTIQTRLEAETLRENPFGFLLSDAAHGRLPLSYSAEEALHPELLRPLSPDEPAVAELTAQAIEASGGATMEFLSALTRILFESMKVEVRHEGAPQSPGETARTRVGACRDIAVLFNECCRSQGMAARFVSGYHAGDPEMPEDHLHAWSEVYLPGGGWRAFDPTHGLAAGEGYVALAASASPRGATPVEGTFRGTGATAEMRISLSLKTRTEPRP